MDKHVYFPPLAIKQIANVMAIQNPSAPNYLKGPELVNLFNALGYPDVYTFEEGRGILTMDYGEGLSRLTYATKRLEDLNKACQIPDALQEFSKRIQQPLEFVAILQRVLKPWNLENFVPKIESEVFQVNNDGLNKPDVVGVEKTKIADVRIEKKNENISKQYDARKKSQEESILGKIPEGHPVVFISYSWDSPEHKAWVAKLADDLTSKGIFVLFDDYLDSGTTLPMFMEYGIVRSDKVLIIGTPKYKEKCTGISSGVAFEDTIIRGSMFQNLGTKKFIPCLREGEFPESFPIILSGCKGHDFSKDDNYDETIDNLCRNIYGKPRRVRPQLGEIPAYAKK